MVMFRGLKLVPMIVLVYVAPKAGPDTSKAKTANRNVLLKVFIGFLSFKGRIGTAVCSHTLVPQRFSTVLTEQPSVVNNDVKTILSKLFTPIQDQGSNSLSATRSASKDSGGQGQLSRPRR